MKKTKILAFIIFIFLSTFLVKPTYAHFPITDGNITVELHVDPNDHPIPGEKSTLYFEFTDFTNQFKLANCNCIVTVDEDGSPILKDEVSVSQKPSIDGQAVPIVFPSNGTYRINMQGNAKVAGEFQPFNMTWNFKVSATKQDTNSISFKDNIIPVLIAALSTIIAFFLIFLLFKSFDKIRDLRKDKV